MVGWFGKRGRAPQELPPQKITKSNWGASTAPAMAPADGDGISRVFSKELFQGETGDFLRSMGFAPDMLGNIAPTAETFTTLDARFKKSLERFAESANRVLLKNGLSVKPLLLVPETIWQGEYRNFLCATCRFYPADPSNVFFLAGTAHTAATLGLPLQAKMSAKEAHEVAIQFVGILGDMYEKVIDPGNAAREAETVAYTGARGLGTIMAVKLFGPAEHDAEQRYFGERIERNFD